MMGPYDREPDRPLRTDDVVHPPEPLAEYDLEQEEDGAERLVLGGGADAATGELRDKGRDLLLSEFSRMSFAVEDYESANPPNVRLLGPPAVMPQTDLGPHLID
jgi:hypothetical protein